MHFGDIVYLLRVLRLVSHNSKKYFCVKCFMVFHKSITPLIITWLAKEIIDALTTSRLSTWNYVLPYVFISLVISAISIIIEFTVSKQMVPLNEQLQLVVNHQIIKKLSLVPVSFFDNVEAYNRVEAATQEIKSLPAVLDNVFNLFSAILTLLVLIPVIASFDAFSILTIILLNIPIVFFQLKIRKEKYVVSKEVLQLERCKTGVLGMLVNKYYAGEIRLFNLFPWLYNKYENYSTQSIEQKQSSNTKQAKLTFGNSSISLFATTLMQLFYISKVIHKVISIGQYTMYNAYVASFNSSIFNLIQCSMNLYEKRLFLQNLTNFLNDQTIAPEQKPFPAYGNQLCADEAVRIEFENVSFSYNKNAHTPVLSHINFCVEAGKTLAIVGLNGAGKSTIINLILRFYTPDEGTIYINNIDINTIPIEEYWKYISAVFQNPMLYPFSLRENITFEREIENVINGKKWIEDIVQKYPNGLETVLLPYFDKNGISPSGGEKQRIALARALSKKSRLLILDEPTSAMDPEIEYYLFQDFREICQNQTSIIITHKLSSATVADTIIYLQNGHIIEQGSHSELLALNKQYARLFKMQSEKYITTS